jgi:hypothetical protein
VEGTSPLGPARGRPRIDPASVSARTLRASERSIAGETCFDQCCAPYRQSQGFFIVITRYVMRSVDVGAMIREMQEVAGFVWTGFRR